MTDEVLVKDIYDKLKEGHLGSPSLLAKTLGSTPSKVYELLTRVPECFQDSATGFWSLKK